jgi:hypothetical protein
MSLLQLGVLCPNSHPGHEPGPEPIPNPDPDQLRVIDISWLDWAYKSFTCDGMYRQQRRHLYYGGEI